MEGTFIKRFLQLPFIAIMLISGTITIIVATSFAINEMRADHLASAIFFILAVLCGVAAILFGVIIHLYNKDAYLVIEDGRINAKYGLNKRFNASINDLINAEVQGEILRLYTTDKFIEIGNLKNAKEVCVYIKQNISNEAKINLDEEKKQLQIHRKKFIVYMTFVIVAIALLFVNILWCAILTEWKELDDFSANQEIIFAVFALVEIIMVIGAFFFANKSGKSNILHKQSKARIVGAMAYEHRKDGLEDYPDVINVKYFDNYLYRIVIFAPQIDIFAYMLEIFDAKTSLWLCCYERAVGFEILSELYDYVDEIFSDVILED